MSDHSIFHSRSRRCFTALFLVFALFVGVTSGYDSSAKTGPDVRAVREATIVEARAALDDADLWGPDADCYGKTTDTIDNIKYILARHLLSDLKLLFSGYDSTGKNIVCIDNAAFQDSFYDAKNVSFYSTIQKVNILKTRYADLGIWDYAKTGISDFEKNQELLTAYNNMIELYTSALDALYLINTYYLYPSSVDTLDVYIQNVIGRIENGLITNNGDSVRKAVDNFYKKFDNLSGYDILWNVLVGGSDTSAKAEKRDFFLQSFPMTQRFLNEYSLIIYGNDSKTVPARVSPTYLEHYKEMLQFCLLEFAYVHRLKDYVNDTDMALDTNVRNNFTEVDENMNPVGLYAVYQNMCDSVSKGGFGSKTLADAFIRTLFNGGKILALINQYENVTAFLSALDVLKEPPTTNDDISRSIAAYNMYAKLTDAEKKRVSSEDLAKLRRCMPAQNTIENVKSLIAAITYPKNETEYRNTFLPALNKAETAYNSLRALYPNMGIEAFVDNRAELTDKYKIFQTYTDRIFDALSIENENVCAKLPTVIEPLRNELIKLNKEKTDIYNHLFSYSSFEERYKDATTALKLRKRVDILMMSPSAQDKAEITSVKNAVAVLNKQAKAYFGTLYEQYIQALEYGTYTDDLNKANRVDTLISRIGTVTSASGDAIKAAMNEYNGLTDVQKSLVKTYPTLVAAQKAYAELSKDVGFADISNIKKGYVYTHSEIQPQPVVVVGSLTLTKGTHYNVAYSNNLNVGTGTVTITAIEGSGYIGTFSKTFLIVQDSVKNCGVSGLKKKYRWTGKKIKPSFKVTVNGFTLSKGSDYKVSYSNNKKVGTATIKIKGIGNYKGTATRKFKIRKKNK